jgi:hypothetical protein
MTSTSEEDISFEGLMKIPKLAVSIVDFPKDQGLCVPYRCQSD